MGAVWLGKQVDGGGGGAVPFKTEIGLLFKIRNIVLQR
jgi:hypothetical protein